MKKKYIYSCDRHYYDHAQIQDVGSFKDKSCCIRSFLFCFFFVGKMKIFTGEKFDVFLIFAQNIDSGYTLRRY